jgi:L-lactate utilization protein LutC
MSYDQLASQDTIKNIIAELGKRNVEGLLVQNKAEALAKIQELIPEGASVMNGSSVTLEQIGFIDLLKSDKHPWNNLHAAIVKEKDPAKQATLRKQALLSDYYLGSVHALVESGQFLIASNTGSQLPHVVYSSSNLIFVVGAQKIVKTLDEAFKRLEEYVIPKEEVHMQQLYGVGTHPNKILIFNGESPMVQRKVRVIIVNESLGF